MGLAMTNIKFVQRRLRADGSVLWAFNPPAYVRELVEVRYAQFDHRLDAEAYAKDIVALYQDAKSRQRKEIHVVTGTVKSLVASYKRTNAWGSLSINTKRTYNQLLNACYDIRLGNSNVLFGDMMASNVSSMHSESVYSHLKLNVSEHRANHTVKVLRRVWMVCQKKSLVRTNPFVQMGLRKLPERVVLWEPEQVNRFIAQADSMGFWSIGTLALLCYHLCQRPGDMRQLLWGNFDGQVFDFVQEKTKQHVTIPASPALIERLAGHERSKADTILFYEATSRPYDRYMIYKVSGRVRKATGLPDSLQMRDLRRTGATEMAEAGCTEDELRSVTGHQSRGVLNTYVRPTKKLAAGGMNKRFG